MEEEYSLETHPGWDFNIPVMKTLILGNFPPHRKRWDYEFFYPNKQNNFWKVLAEINGSPLNHMTGNAAVEERKHLMQVLKTGVLNIAHKVRRKGASARDTDIEILEYNDVIGFIEKHPELEIIIIAGYSAKNSTAKKFMEYLAKHKIKFKAPPEITAGAQFPLYVKNRTIKCVIVNSTSTAFPIKLKDLADQFRPYIKKGNV